VVNASSRDCRPPPHWTVQIFPYGGHDPDESVVMAPAGQDPAEVRKSGTVWRTDRVSAAHYNRRRCFQRERFRLQKPGTS
jgi:hypothetical protein